MLLAFFLCHSAVSCSWAKLYYVDSEASGTNDGSSWNNAWTSFGDIDWNSVKAGDTIFISGGKSSRTYLETLDVKTSGSPGSRIRIRVGQDRNHCGKIIIDGQKTRNHCIVLNQHVAIDGKYDGEIRIICRNSKWAGIKSGRAVGNFIRYVEIHDCGDGTAAGGFNHGIHLNKADGCEVSHCHIHHNHQDGYNASGSVGDSFGNNKVHHCKITDNSDDGIACRSGHDIYNNVIADCFRHPDGGEGHPDGIQAQGSFTRIWNNKIYDCHTHAIFADPLRSGDAEYIWIWNNLVYRTSESLRMHGIKVKKETGTNSISNILIANNTVVDTGYGAIEIKCDATSDVIVKNNIVYNCRLLGKQGFVMGTNDDNGLIDYNCVNGRKLGSTRMKWDGNVYDYADFVSIGFGQEHGQTDDPFFADYSEMDYNGNGQDFRLTGKSKSCRGKGDDLSEFFTTDMEGATRSVWDIGCYAYTKGE